MSDREPLIREEDDQEIISESPERENETESQTRTFTETGIETETRLERNLGLVDAVGENQIFIFPSNFNFYLKNELRNRRGNNAWLRNLCKSRWSHGKRRQFRLFYHHLGFMWRIFAARRTLLC
jgi:hypothetical protein